MCSFGSCQTRFEFLSQFRKVRNAFECFVTQVQTHLTLTYSTNHVYLHSFFAFVILRLRLKRKTHPAFRVLNAFYFQTDFNLRFKCKRDVRLTCRRVWCWYIAHYRSNGYAPLHRTLSLKWIWPAVSETLVLNETKPTKRSQITDQNLRKEANAKCAVLVHAKRVSNS